MRHFLYILIFFILFSCSEYQKVLKSNDVNLKFEKAVYYYNKEDFARAMPLFKELSLIMRGTTKSEEIIYYLSYCHYNSGDYITSSYLFENYIKTFPNGKHFEECFYMSAYCIYLESPDYSLDDTFTRKAIKELQDFMDRYPNSIQIDKCSALVVELNGKLSLKAFEIAKQYYETEHYKAAIIDLNNVLIDFPNNVHREEIQFLILKSSYELAMNSITEMISSRLNDALDAIFVFIDNYPNSKYIKEAKRLSENIQKKLNNKKK